MGGSEQPSTDSSYVPWRTALRWVGIGTSILGAGALAALVAFWTVVDAEYLQRRLNHALANTPVEHYRVEVERVEWGLLDQSLQLHEISVSPGLPTTVQPQIWKTALPRRVQASVSTVRLEGIHLWPLVRHQRLILDAVRLHDPWVRVEGSEGQTTAPRDSWASPRAGSALSLGPLRSVTIHRFGLDGGTFVAKRGRGQPRDSLWGVSLRLDSLSTDALADRSPARVLATRFSQGAIGGYRRTLPERLYNFRIGPSRVSKPDSTLSVTRIRFTPTVSDPVFMRRYEHRVNRVRMVARRILAEGVRVDRLVRDSTVHADRARIDSMHLSVYRDNHLPPEPRDPPPPMPHEAARAFENVFRIDTLRIRDSGIRYVKRAEEAQHAGGISFENLWASLYNVTNSPQRMTPSRPAVAVLRTDVNGAGRLQATFRVPLRARSLSLSFEGRLGPMDATALNETFVHLGGVRIESGQVDSLWFQADVEQGLASGSLRSVYRNLEIETLDKATGDRGLKNRLKTLVVSGLALRSSNLPSDEPFHVGQIRHRHEEGNTFFKFLWLSLRSGMYSMVGIDRLPR